MTSKQFKEKIAPTLPDMPGVYRFTAKDGSVLYVGKAKSIRKRVINYFGKGSPLSGRIMVLLRRTHRILYTVVQTEHDALLLENSFIKKHQPRYNIQLKDDKTFPFICIRNEPFPRVFLTRRRVNDGSEYLGPYTSVKRMKYVLNLLRGLYPLRSCNLNLSEAKIKKHKYRVCLEYHIGNCMGPCEGLQTPTEYKHSINQIRDILKGKTASVISQLKNEMTGYAEQLSFEKADATKKRIHALEDFQSSSAIVSPRIDNVDVFGVYRKGQVTFVNYFRMANGTVVLSHVAELRNKLDESLGELLTYAVHEIRSRFDSSAPEVIVPVKIEYPDTQVRIMVPVRGEKKLLLDLCTRNAREYGTFSDQRISRRREHSSPVLQSLMKDLRLGAPPTHIECIDNSNIQGTTPVSALVVFRDGRPSKEEYRHYNIQTVSGPNDFASMEEVVLRRYRHAADEDRPLPQLLLIDGGKGQLHAALKSLALLGLEGKITVAGIAKRLEEIYLADDPLPLHLNKRSSSLRLLQHIRDEAHRFAVSFHRRKRDSMTLKSELTSIPGIGDGSARELLKAFGSVKKIIEASEDDLARVVGRSRAQKVRQRLQDVGTDTP